MENIYKVNPELDVPIYKQLVDAINTAIKRGALTPGQQLPTVQEMTDALKIARGTVKRAYDELEISGAIERFKGAEHLFAISLKIQGAGRNAP